MARRPPKTKDEAKARRSAVEQSGAFLASFTPAYEVLTNVRAVRTIFPQIDWATRVHGWPIERITVAHGKSNEGKTLLALGLIGSFLRLGHFALLVDAECTTPIDWVEKLIGTDARSKRFSAIRPSSYEQTVDQVRAFLRGVASLREAKKVSPETSAIVVVDSLRKLVPEDILARIAKDGASGAKGSIDGMGGRAAQIRAALNAAWMDELVPLLQETRGAVLLIAREAEDPNADIWDRKFGNDFKVGGGKAVIYDASLVVRVSRAGWIYDADKRVIGERIRVSIRKTKVGGKEGRYSDAYFHIRAGHGGEGFDVARDYVELGRALGVIEGSTWLTWGEHKWNGEARAVEAISSDPSIRADLDVEIRSKFEAAKPFEYDDDGVME